MSVPLVSIVTPSFEQAAYLPDNLESVENQTHPRVEHVVLDGGSEDRTTSILRSFEGEYELKWRSEQDDGQSSAINEGFEQARGEYVGWLNSDDVYLDTGVLKRVCEHFERTGADVVYGDLAYVDRESRITEVDVRPDFDASRLPYRILLGQPATFFRRAVIKNNRLNTTLDFCMDYEFWIRLSRRYNIQHVQDILAGFRVHEAQKTENQTAMKSEVKAMLERYYDSADLDHGPGVLISNARTETLRVLRSLRATYTLSKSPPPLAFDGQFLSLSKMVGNVGPSVPDITKSLRRWQR